MVLFACAGLLALPTAAGALPPGLEVQPKKLRLELSLPGSHGFDVEIESQGHRQVTLQTYKDSVFSTYTVQGSVSHTHIKAEFGDMGRVSVRFEGSPRPPWRYLPEPECIKGRAPIKERGTFRGTITFEGEHGYTRVSAQSAPGRVKRFFKRICKQNLSAFERKADSPGGTEEPPINLLSAYAESVGGNIFFLSASHEATPAWSEIEPVPSPLVWAGINEYLPGMWIRKVTFIDGGPGSAIISKRGVSPVTATVALPKPFSGTASFRQESGATPSWVGSLALRLPGEETVPLTGAGFTSLFCRGISAAQQDACWDSAERVLDSRPKQSSA